MGRDDTGETAAVTSGAPAGGAVGEPDAQGAASDASPRWKTWAFRAFVALAVLFFSAATLFRFGSMWLPSREQTVAFERLVAAGQAAAITRRQFHIPIPGCVCHSDDPAQVAAHADRRISECMTCH